MLLDMGASPICEALSLLTSDMLVERIGQRGFRAAPASPANFEEILKLRCTLEDMALRQSRCGCDLRSFAKPLPFDRCLSDNTTCEPFRLALRQVLAI